MLWCMPFPVTNLFDILSVFCDVLFVFYQFVIHFLNQASWDCSRSQGLGCSPIKAVRELGSERRETVRSLSGVGVGYLRGAVLSTRGPGWTGRWCICCSANCMAE